MKNLKSFVERHIYVITLLGTAALVLVGTYLGKFNHFWFLLDALAILFYLFVLFLQINKDWVCANCGEKAIVWRYKFCSACGSIMHAVKKEKILCLRSHRVSKYDNFCPKCGVPLSGEGIFAKTFNG